MLSNQNPSEQYLEYLILNGYVEVAGVDQETGDFLYAFTEEARVGIPGLQDQLNEDFYGIIVYLWELGFLSMDIASSDPKVTIAPKALDQAEINKLPTLYRKALLSIIDALRIQ